MRKAMIYAVLGVCCAFAVGVVSPVMAETKLQPFVLASRGTGTVEKMIPEVREKLTGAGLVIVGAYEPYKGAQVVVVTTEESRRTAGLSEFGGYGAAQRVSLTQMGEEVQTVYTNPAYMASVYRMEGDLAEIAGKLKVALGAQEYFGSKKGLTAKKLRKYHYMVMMPYDEVRGVSRRAEDEEVRKKIKERLAEMSLPDGFGVIARTNAIELLGLTLT